jgi:TolB-like protein
MAAEKIAFGAFTLDPGGGALTRDGIPLPISYRGLRILTALADRPGEVLNKATLMQAGWDGAAVEEANLTVQVANLRKLLGPAPDGGDWIATVPRVGYRFTGEARRRAAEDASSGFEHGASIAVLAFANLSGDADQAYFAEGLAEDIIARLSRVRGLFVSARSSSFAYGGAAVDIKRVGAELGVRYVLEGSVRRSDFRMRIVAQLNDAATGLHVWADRYDVELSDFLALQDQIAEAVTAAIEPRLYAAEHTRLADRPPESLGAWGLVMRAVPYVWTWGSAEDLDVAAGYLKRALEIDPDYARANSLLAWNQAARVQLGLTDVDSGVEQALHFARRAVARDHEDAWSHLAIGYAHMVGRATEPAVESLREALALHSSLSLAHIILGSTYGYAGMAEDGLHELAQAARLSPRDYTQGGNLATAGLCHFVAHRFDLAIAAELRAVELRPHFGTAWRTLTAAAGVAGNTELAARGLAEMKRLQPTVSVDWVEKYHPIVRREDRDLYIAGLRAAGLT